MIEVLITIVIVAIGLLGLFSMQSRLQQSEVESYQRTQAMMLLNDMASRISANRANAADYVTGPSDDPASLGGTPCPTANATLQERDRAEWCDQIQGAAEVQSGANVGALINGRGCVYERFGGAEYQVTVVWQGLSPINSPNIICGKESPNPFDGPAGSSCVDDKCRRVVTTSVRLGELPP